MQVIDQVIDPGSTHMLIDSHGPERVDLTAFVSVDLCQFLDLFGRDAAQFFSPLGGKRLHQRLVLVKGKRLGLFLGVFFVLQSVRLVFRTSLEIDMLLDKSLIIQLVAQDDMDDCIDRSQIPLWIHRCSHRPSGWCGSCV